MLVDRQAGGHGRPFYPQPQPTLPPSLKDAHITLIDAASRMEVHPLLSASGSASSTRVAQAQSATGGNEAGIERTPESSLPDSYMFSSLGLSLEGGRYSFAPEKLALFIPSSPQVAQNQIFNFDHGALDTGILELTSYMVWF